jgi:DNA end-binding protein Ku
MEMATSLLDSMASDFNPDDYKDEFRERLQTAIKKRMKQKGTTTKVEEEEAPTHDATTNVVDFMALLKKSLEKKGDAPAKATARKAAKKPATKKAPAPATSTSKSKKSA